MSSPESTSQMLGRIPPNVGFRGPARRSSGRPPASHRAPADHQRPTSSPSAHSADTQLPPVSQLIGPTDLTGSDADRCQPPRYLPESPEVNKLVLPAIAASFLIAGCGESVPAAATASPLTFPVVLHLPHSVTLTLTRTGHDAGRVTREVVVTPTELTETSHDVHFTVTYHYTVTPTAVIEDSETEADAAGVVLLQCSVDLPGPWNRSLAVGDSWTGSRHCTTLLAGGTKDEVVNITATVTGSAAVTVGGRTLETVVTKDVAVASVAGLPTVTTTSTKYHDVRSGLDVRVDESQVPSGFSNELLADQPPA
jgi:hypothetical protein